MTSAKCEALCCYGYISLPPSLPPSLPFFAGIWTLSQNAFIAGAIDPVPVCKMEGEIHSMRHIIHHSHNDIFRWMCILIIKSMAAFYVACIYSFFGWSLKLRPLLVNGKMSVYPSSCRTEGQNFPNVFARNNLRPKPAAYY